MPQGDRLVLGLAGIDALLAALRSLGYRTLGPRLRDGVIAYDDVGRVADLPAGWSDEQERGRYRVGRRSDDALFGYTVGPHSWKRYLHPPRLTLWRARRQGQGFDFEENGGEPARYAFIGVRACELRAMAVQDRVFMGGPWSDPHYRALRERAFVVAVNCARAGATCFCASMGTGPRAAEGYDLALTELLREGRHEFLLEVGSERGAEVAGGLPGRPAQAADVAAAEDALAAAAGSMGRSLETHGLPELLEVSYEHPRWEKVAERCLACANCTMVCPTCFCTTVEDVGDLSGQQAERRRGWDSCFTQDFSYIHGGSVRSSTAARYRQWLTHKLGTWHEQFGSSGCVGCGRCITWCPVGIDLTEEVRALRDEAAPGGREHGDRIV